jgi:DNA-binding NtrC family response regulator
MSFDDSDALFASAVPSSRQPMPNSRQRRLVLVIDDDALMRQSLQILLESEYMLILAASAKEGVSAFNENVCAVILDIKMGPLDGFWACDEIRKIQPDVPVIFHSAYQDAKDPFGIINEHRPFGYITKNGDPSRLLRTLETATLLHQSTLRSRRLLKKLSGSAAVR